MKYRVIFFLTAFIAVFSSSVLAKSIEEYIGEAESKQQPGEIAEAVQIMKDWA